MNHFIEVDYSEKEDAFYLVIHSGSRNLGARVCDYYQAKAVKYCRDMGLPTCKDELAYLDRSTLDFIGYLYDAGTICNTYAKINREIMAASIMRDFFEVKGWNLKKDNDSFHCIHNYIDMKESTPMIRKGAISSKLGEKVIIPLNMRDGCIIGTGKGNPDWNYSAPHGAGRVLSRGKAKKEISMDDFIKSMEGIYSTSVNEHTIDESPMAYKDPELIKAMIGETVTIDDIIKPIYNFKAPEQRRR